MKLWGMRFLKHLMSGMTRPFKGRDFAAVFCSSLNECLVLCALNFLKFPGSGF